MRELMTAGVSYFSTQRVPVAAIEVEFRVVGDLPPAPASVMVTE